MADAAVRIQASLPDLDERLFPLPLSPFEKYLIWDETPLQPMTSFIELTFASPMQVKVMDQAICLATRIHPMLACVIDEHQGELVWVYDEKRTPRIVSELVLPVEDSSRPKPIDLRREVGVRFWYRERNDGRSRLLIQLHHAVTDGVGMRRFLIDSMTIYGILTGNDATAGKLPWQKVDPNLLLQRFDFKETFSGAASLSISLWQRFKNAYYFHFLLPSPLRGMKSVGTTQLGKKEGDQESFEPLEHLTLERGLSEAILEKSRVSEVGVNDLSLALLFQTCAQWNQQNGNKNPRTRIRLLMPYDLRSRIDMRMPATNRLSFAFLGRDQKDCADQRVLLQSVMRETNAIRESRLPLDFLGALTVASRHPRLMRWAIRKSRNMATAVLTYAGDTSRGMQKYFPEEASGRRVGDTLLENILAAPPVRQNTNISLGLCVNWGQLCISAAWNQEVFSREDCAAFLNLYRQHWISWLESN